MQRPPAYRQKIESTEPDVLAEIYQEINQIAVWQRQLAPDFVQSLAEFLSEQANRGHSWVLTPKQVEETITTQFANFAQVDVLAKDIAQITDMFCCLFDLGRVGLRLAVLSKPMCPRFHVDKIPCRLITTYVGNTTQWLPHQGIDRSKLGRGSGGLPDETSGLIQSVADIQQLGLGDVALLKGESWQGNEGAGLVHRSPAVAAGEKRLVMTLDFAD